MRPVLECKVLVVCGMDVTGFPEDDDPSRRESCTTTGEIVGKGGSGRFIPGG